MEKILSREELERAKKKIHKVIKNSGTTIHFDIETERNIFNPESNAILLRGSFVKSDGQELSAIAIVDAAHDEKLMTWLIEDTIEGFEADRKRKEI